jgi:hypothetical protein
MSNIMQDANVRMIQAGDGLRFLLEALAQCGIIGKVRGKDLDGDDAVQARVPRAVHFSHASSAERRQDFVRAEASARDQCHNGVDYISSNQALG